MSTKLMPRAVFVFILLIIGLAFAGWYVTGSSEAGREPAGAPEVEMAGEPFAATGTVRVDNVARMTVQLWSAPAWTADLSPDGTPLSALAQGTPVEITRRAEEQSTGRVSYLVRTEGTRGWIAAAHVEVRER